ncbi:MAG: hypothetical protein V8S12_01795 [Lachnospiraceae bacterium]
MNEQELATEYTGWWYTCIPLRCIDNDNLPLPIFIHRDDVEYGLRVGKKKFIFLNGIGVWHEAFEKKWQVFWNTMTSGIWPLPMPSTIRIMGQGN